MMPISQVRKCWRISTPLNYMGDQILRRLLFHQNNSGQRRFGWPELSGQLPSFFALTVEAWPSREIGHPCPEILVPFLEDENLLTGLETLHIWIELLAYEGLYSIVHSLSVEASHRQLSVWYGIDSALPSLQQSGEPARITAPGGSDYRCPRSSCFWANEKGGSRSL